MGRYRTNRLWPAGLAVVLASLSPLAVFAGPPADPAQPAVSSDASADEERPAVSLRGIIAIGNEWFSAGRSFKAITGKSSGILFGGGGHLLLRNGIFVEARVERYQKAGQRVFVYQGEVFRLGIKDTITVTPVLVTVGYRFTQFGRVIPYGGGGAGWYSFTEKADFAEAGDDLKSRRVGYHAVGGAEFALWRWVAAAAEAEFASVPNALGRGGVSQAYGEKNLGGVTARVKILIGR